MSLSLAEQTAKWLVGDQLSCVLHLQDSPLAYQLADQGHEVTILDSQVTEVHHSDICYVRSHIDHMPFASNVFDVVVTSGLDDTQSALAEFARVLRPRGLLSTLIQSYDESIPWLRKLNEIIGRPQERSGPSQPDSVDTFLASGLFHPPEKKDAGSWQQLDLDGFIQFARSSMPHGNSEESLDEVRQLWDSYGARTGSLRLRQQTTCLRAEVDKSALPQQPDPPDVKLFDFR